MGPSEIPGKIKSFIDLNAWKEGHKLVLSIYSETSKFPREEKFGLTDQLRRSSVSITSNVAEGFSRFGKAEKKQFYRMALGKDEFKTLIEMSITISKLLNGLIKSVS